MVLVGGIISAILLVKYLKYLRDKCPKCGRRGWRCFVTPKEIEGTRRTYQRIDSRGQRIEYQEADFKVTTYVDIVTTGGLRERQGQSSSLSSADSLWIGRGGRGRGMSELLRQIGRPLGRLPGGLGLFCVLARSVRPPPRWGAVCGEMLRGG
jgi:hypothetical protein